MLDNPQRPAYHITPREMQILRLLAQGLENKEIAQDVGGSARTVELHIKRVREKLGATNRTHAVALAVGLGIVQIVEPLGAGKCRAEE